MNLLITAQAPTVSTAGQTAQLILTAVSQLQDARASNIDTVTLTAGAAVVVTLAASSASAIPGDSLEFTATVRNSGAGIASPAAISLNGAPASLFVLRVPVPPNVVFASAQTLPSADVQVLYHLLGSPADSFTSRSKVVAGFSPACV